MDSLANLQNQIEGWADALDPLANVEQRNLLAGTLAEILRADECAVMAADHAGEEGAACMDQGIDQRTVTAVGRVAESYVVLRATRSSESFSSGDARLLELAAYCVAKGVEAARLRGALRSRFTQMAALKQSGGIIGPACEMIAEHPDKTARLLARSFYREMLQAGFECNQIINAASEIVSELSKNLRRRTEKVGRKFVPAPDAR